MSGNEEKKLTVPKFSSFKPKAPDFAPLNQSAVPKFSSFKPKPSSPAQSTQPSHDEAARARKSGTHDTDREKRHRHESRHHDDRPRHRSEHRSENRHRDQKRKTSRSRERPVVKKIAASQSFYDRASNGVFVIDTKGDPLIRRYGGNDRSRVPLYRRGGRGRILGSDGYLYIHRDGPQERFSIRQPGEGSSVFRDRALLQSKVHRVKPKRIRVRVNPGGDHARNKEEDFVPLSTSSKRRRTEESGSSGDEKPSYRSIEGKAKAHEFSDSDVDFDSEDSQDEDIHSVDPLKHRSIELSRQVKERPQDIEAWLELINHQDVLLNAGSTLDREVTKGEIHSFAEIKISMYESALAQAKTVEDEERLLLGLMLEGAKVWSSSKLENRWVEVAKKHESSFCLWKARVDHKLTNLSTFQYNDIKALCVDRLRAVPKQTKVSLSPGPGYEANDTETSRYEQMIYVFLRATKLAYGSGFREMAVAAWQALIELSLQRPSVCGTMAEPQILDMFRNFWEDEAPRIGEDNALGWNNYVQADGAVEPPEPQRDDDAIRESRDVYKSWGATELVRAQHSRTPGRATDDVLEDDPYRVVMFSDIEDLLFVVPKETVPRVRRQLIDAFLLFCCLPPAFRASNWTEAAENDTLIAGSSKLFENDVLRKPNEPDTVDETKKLPSFQQDGSRFAASADLLFGGPEWFSLFSGWTSTSRREDGPVELSWAANTLRLLVHSGDFKELGEYSLAVDVVDEPGSTKKRAKALIKQDPNNLSLYNAYALAESAKGKIEVGRQVVATAMGLVSPSNRGDGLMLGASWAWMELQAGHKEQAVARLCTAADESLRAALGSWVATPAQLLKAHQTMQASLEQQLSINDFDAAAVTAECVALLMYLTAQEGSEPTSEAQGSISAAMERIWTVSSELCARGRSKSQGHERLLQAAARLLYHHASRGPFRRAYLREQLHQCIELFPRNTMFLSLFAWASTTFGIDDPVRDILRKVALANTNGCISNRIFAIRYELQRGNVHSTQAAFERALDNPACRSNPDLWRCYIKFSYARKQFRHKAKDVFFRGLQCCPWSKELALEAYTTLINIMDEFELRSVFNTMTSKGLRIHIDLEEFVGRHDKTRAKRGEGH
ncbi:NRDE2-like protein [Colletotrichum chlorophyti]|uniref:NRDE2-like protein n=1 Tax=Colletotrichum chlorophyti TaxID=708187 RepID=A0A1Q8S011_9PEZI|nr:NRDE2-like protein [Colletotrichum chlorophyti]